MKNKNIIQNKGGIYFENIRIGFENFKFEKLKMKTDKALDFFKRVIIENGEDNCFADFYINKIDEKAREIVFQNLEQDEINYIKQLKPIEDVFYKLDEKLLPILLKLNENEILFSTFYFTKNEITFWGNYNCEYIAFTKKD